MKQIKNIIFDFGGVIIDIHHKRVENAFKDLGVVNFEELFSQAVQSDLFRNFETGNIPPEQFRNELRELCGLDMNDIIIDKTWNAIIGIYPPHRIQLLKLLSQNYRLFLLSNTNQIHYDHYIPKFEKEFGFDFFSLFERTYWSFKIGMRKPNLNAYDFVLEDSNLEASETLFIDDSPQNIEPAEKLGITCLLLKNGADINSLFCNGILL